MPTRRIEWRHNRQRLVLPVVVFASTTAANPNLSVPTDGLLDTGATSTGLHPNIVKQLGLVPKGQRRVATANDTMMASEFLVRIGFVCGDHRDPNFDPDREQPYILEEERLGFGLKAGFTYPVLIGMDVIGAGDLAVGRDGIARFTI